VVNLRLSTRAVSLSYTLALYSGCTFNEVNCFVHTVTEEFDTGGLTTPFHFSCLSLDANSSRVRRLIRARSFCWSQQALLTRKFAPDSAPLLDPEGLVPPSGPDVLARQLSQRPTGLACALV
jgi:hypothetical protein